jgi:hypothetical protein
MTDRERRRLEQLEQELLAEEEHAVRTDEIEELNRLQFAYMNIPEYREMELLTEDLLTALEEHGETAEETLEINERAGEAYERWLNRARELEREEQQRGKTQE